MGADTVASQWPWGAGIFRPGVGGNRIELDGGPAVIEEKAQQKSRGLEPEIAPPPDDPPQSARAL